MELKFNISKKGDAWFINKRLRIAKSALPIVKALNPSENQDFLITDSSSNARAYIVKDEKMMYVYSMDGVLLAEVTPFFPCEINAKYFIV